MCCACSESQLLEEVRRPLRLLLAGHLLLVHVPVVKDLLEAPLDADLALRVREVGLADGLLEVEVDLGKTCRVFTYLTKGFIALLLFSTLALDMTEVTFRGFQASPATRQCENLLSLFPSSNALTTIAFLPACQQNHHLSRFYN
jgi:hypothetical protein